MRLLLITAALCFGSLGSLSAQTTVRVLSYNIHRDIGASDSNISAQPSLAKIVNYLKPDVWTIAELGGNNASFNAINAHNYLVGFIQDRLTVFGPNPQPNINFFVYVGTINDGFITQAVVSRYPFDYTNTYSDAGGGYGALRGLVSASVRISGSPNLDVFTTHLKALSTTNDARRRQAEANTNRGNVSSWMASHPANAVAVTGDWNETEDPGEPCNWDNHQIGDILPSSGGQAYLPITTMHSPGLIDPSPGSINAVYATISAASPNARFDYAMFARASYITGQVFDTNQYSPMQLAALNTANGTNFVSTDSATASDHLPVLVVLQVGGGSRPPLVLGMSRLGNNFSITYEKIISSNYTYSVESSNNLLSWTVAAPQNQVLEQHGDIQTVKATVATGTATRLFLRVRVTVTP